MPPGIVEDILANSQNLCAADGRILVEAFHFSFPAWGHGAKASTGYELVSVEWRPLQS
jgi:hypothetical protein